ncbi:sororin [Elgaria multicarinata webbii]|uniref:sororin n=1 Tax=Elgaria multicarinata webbii TaxID=159646 RepID=UPI002FCD5646
MAGGGGRRGSCRPGRARSAGEARAGAALSPPRRRSERNATSTAQPLSQGKPVLVASKTASSPHPGPFVMRPITLKKIVPRNRQIKVTAGTPRRSPRISLKEDKENMPLGAVKGKSPVRSVTKMELKLSPPRCSSDPEMGASLGVTDDLSPVGTNAHGSPLGDERDLAMAKRVRRSYSRLEVSLSHSFQVSQESPSSDLSDTSTPNHGPGKRQTLFGFEKLLVPGLLADVSPVNASTTQKLAAIAPAPGTLCVPDNDIPGISFVKEKRRKKKMPQFDKSELDEWATQMNAEFEEAERFDLLVE